MIDYEVDKNITIHNLQCFHANLSLRTCIVLVIFPSSISKLQHTHVPPQSAMSQGACP